jgi:uncharacterized delta-60 repeat protein
MKKLIAFLCLLLLTQTTNHVLAQTWTRTLDGGASGDDVAYAVAVTPTGEVVVGASIDRGSHTSCAIIKYTGAGDTMWFRTYDPYPGFDGWVNNIAVTANGSIFAACGCKDSSSTWAAAVIKLAPDGSIQKEFRYSAPAHVYDCPKDMVLDHSQNCIVVCDSKTSQDSEDIAVLKLDSAGNPLWVSRYDLSNRYNQANAVDADSAGSIYIAGETITSWSEIASLTKLTPAGETAWSALYQSPGEQTEFCDVSVRRCTAFVTGYVSMGTPRILTARYTDKGDTAWVRELVVGYGVRLATSDSLGVIVAGCANDSLTQEDFKTIRYGADGSRKWIARYDGPGHNYDVPSAIAVSPDGEIYLAGQTRGVSTLSDCATLRYNADGGLLWSARYSGSGSPSIDEGTAMCLDSLGNVIVAGFATMASTGEDILLIKYPPTGPGVAEAPRVSIRDWALAVSPNPARGRFAVCYDVPRSGRVSVGIYDVSGRLVKPLAAGAVAAGRYSAGVPRGALPAGTYFVTLVSGVERMSRKVVLTRAK